MNNKIKSHYDVVIIGASFAGLSCVKILAKSNKEVLVLDKSNQPGAKACGCGVEDEDLEFVSESDINFPMASLFIEAKGKMQQMSEGRGLISSIVRPNVINKWKNQFDNLPNIQIELNTKVVKVNLQDKNIIIDDDIKISYDYLVGADSSFSIVRNTLGLSVAKYMAAINYRVENFKTDKFLMAADWVLFDKGYAWIFPNKNFTSIGCAVDYSSGNLRRMHQNLDEWLKKKNISLEGQFEGSIINYDYKGYKFNDVYLAGDAAGVADGLTGKGIYAACLSGKLVAQEILRKVEQKTLEQFNSWLEEKQRNENILNLDKNFLELKLSQH